MKVLLIRPKPDVNTIGLQHVMICEPLELETIAAHLLDEHQVIIYDMILEKQSLQTIIQTEKPDWVGLTGYIAHVNILKKYCEQIKSSCPNAKVVVGGVHAEVVPDDFADGHFDYILASNGIENFKKLLRGETLPRICKGEKKPLVPHLIPARHLVERYRKSYYYMFHNPCSLIKTSMGCPYQCAFCFCKHITDGQYFTRELTEIIKELQHIPEKEIYIVDDDFLFNASRLKQFCELLEAHGIKKNYLVYGRADFIAQNPACMAKLKKAGLRAVIVGLETFSDQELDLYNKKSAAATSVEALSVLRHLDIECYGTFVIGLDWTRLDFKKLYRFIRSIELQFINLQPLTPMPGTSLYAGYEGKWIIPREDFAKWDMAHVVVKPTHLSLRAYYFEIVKLYYKITLHPKMILRSLRKYPLHENVKLSIGANRVMFQYIKRIMKGHP